MDSPLDFFRPRRPKLPPDRRRYRVRRRVSAQDIRVTIWIGLILGLLANQALRFWAPTLRPISPTSIEQVTVDPYAESRRSREILERQEGPPTPVARRESTRIPRAAVRLVDGDRKSVVEGKGVPGRVELGGR